MALFFYTPPARAEELLSAKAEVPLLSTEDCLSIGQINDTFINVPFHYRHSDDKYIDGDFNPSAISADNLDKAERKRIRVAYFSPNIISFSRQKGTIIIIGGRRDFIENYCDVISTFRKNSYGVFVYDLRGQGISDRIIDKHKPNFYEKSYVENFRDYVNDHDMIMARFSPALIRPIYIVSQGMGGHIATRLLIRENHRMKTIKGYRTPYHKFVIINPEWRWRFQDFLYFINHTMMPVAGKMAYFPGAGGYRPEVVRFNQNTHSEKRMARKNDMIRKNKSLRLGGITYQGLLASIHSNHYVERAVLTDDGLADNKIPTLIVLNDGNIFVEQQTTHLIAQRVGHSQVSHLSDYKNSMLQEDNPRLEKLFDIVINFLNNDK